MLVLLLLSVCWLICRRLHQIGNHSDLWLLTAERQHRSNLLFISVYPAVECKQKTRAHTECIQYASRFHPISWHWHATFALRMTPLTSFFLFTEWLCYVKWGQFVTFQRMTKFISKHYPLAHLAASHCDSLTDWNYMYQYRKYAICVPIQCWRR